MRRLSSTDSAGKRPRPSGTSEMPRRATRSPRMRVMSRPSNHTVPEDGRRRPPMVLSSVVLPAPLGPSRATISPASTSRLTSLTAAIWPYSTRTRSARSSGMARLLAEIGGDHLGVAAHHLGRAPRDHAPEVEHVDVVAEREHEVDVVLDDQHAEVVVAADAAEQLGEL